MACYEMELISFLLLQLGVSMRGGWNGDRRGSVSSYRGGGDGHRAPPPSLRTNNNPRKTLVVNREQTCPFLLRVFTKDNERFNEQEFQFKRQEHQPNELHIYTWKDVTLGELTDLIKSTYAPAQARTARLCFSIVYPNRSGENVLSEIGNTFSSRSCPDDKKTLSEVTFEIGDYLAVARLVKCCINLEAEMSLVYGKNAYHEALDAVCQFLDDRGLTKAMRVLCEEAHHEYNPDQWGKDTLLNAIHVYQDHLHSNTINTNQDDMNQTARKDAEHLLLDLAALTHSNPVPTQTKTHTTNFQANVIAVRFVPQLQHDPQFALAAGVDKALSFIDLNNGDIVHKVHSVVDGAILAVEFNPVFKHLLAVSCMNGKHHVINWKLLLQNDREGYNAAKAVISFNDHTFKYVLNIKWSYDGKRFATTSNDHTANVYVMDNVHESTDDQALPTFTKVHQFLFRETAESILWTDDALVMGLRGDNFLNFYDPETLKKKENLNMNTTGDNHVSFTPMHLSHNKTTNFIAVATDKNRTILLTPGCDGPITSFHGAVNDEYSTPRTCFNNNGAILYSTSQDNIVVAWELATQKVLHRFEGHKKLIRDIDYNCENNELLSGSYDKTVRLWSA